jgi:penicillin-binding protein-related factor A (putative recombinase)
MNSEDLFQTLFIKYGKQAYLFKLTDTKEVSGMNKRMVKTKEQPADFLICINGETSFAEVKSSENEVSFPFGNIRTGQIAHARRFMAAGGTYWFYILRVKTLSWFRVPAAVILDCPKSSLKWSELQPWRL